MMNFTLITAFILCSLSWISVSESQTVKAQVGEDVKLLSDKIANGITFWFKLVNRSKISCISVRSSSTSPVKYCDGYNCGRFNMTSNTSNVFLDIKKVEVSDSGLYSYGFYTEGIVTFTETRLIVKDESEGRAKLPSVILGSLTVFLLMVIIGLVVKIRKLQTAHKEEQSPEQRENVNSDDLNYAAVTIRPKARRREPEPNVIYASTR